MVDMDDKKRKRRKWARSERIAETLEAIDKFARRNEKIPED
jgi:hypothetical protein